ncbi:MAG: 16S rRNA (uracil(1498)-N(3))-methyltransferase [Acidobacteria bacterium]|nr:MAG: 16S rRNA (uracil(1498)-N(3))-methyltransferase [Acidobacteriota bacterium]
MCRASARETPFERSIAARIRAVSAPRVFVPDVPIAADFKNSRPYESVTLPDDEAHHISRVLRLKSGDAIVIFNGRGGAWDAEIVESGKRGVTAKVTRAHPPHATPPARVTLAVGLLKGDAMDAVVRDATALGAAEIIPMATAHAVVPKRARGDEAIARWTRVAVASAKQCGRTAVPVISDVADFNEVIRRDIGTKLLCVEPALGGVEVSAMASDAVLLLIGPEGGWSDAELTSARAAGCHAITLGPLTLRAELAPVVALTRVWAAIQT